MGTQCGPRGVRLGGVAGDPHAGHRVHHPGADRPSRQPLEGSMSVISLRDLTKVFPSADGNDLLVLDRLSFEVADREFVCLVGPSGSGKTVSLNVVAGLLSATSGSVIVDGASVADEPAPYGYVFQQPRLLPWKTVEDNIRFALRAKTGRPAPNEAQRIVDIIGLVGLRG